MLCEKCQTEIDTVICNKCGEEIRAIGNFCYMCGAELRMKSNEQETEIDLSSRILCSDGTCIGVVENGVCKLCGKPYIPEQ